MSPSPAVRSTVLACLFFAGFGCLIPFLPLWLEKVHGFSGAEIGVVLAIAGFSRAIAGPVTAAWADGRSDRRAPLFMFTILLTVGFAVLRFLDGFAAVFALILLLDIAYWGLLPVVETALLRLTKDGRVTLSQDKLIVILVFAIVIPVVGILVIREWIGLEGDGFLWAGLLVGISQGAAIYLWLGQGGPTYGGARGLASYAFVIGNLGVGWLCTRLGSAWPVWGFTLVVSALMILASVWMPREPVVAAQERKTPFPERLSAGLGMLRNPTFTLFIFAAGLIQASAGFLYTAGSLVWINAQGISSSVVGVLWAVGTLAEVGFLMFLGGWSARFRPETLIVAGGVGAVVRWTALATLPPVWLLVPLQLLHALSFAATFLGGMRFIQTIHGDDRAPTAQMIYMGLANAPTYAAAVLISGPLYDRVGAAGYLAMSAIAALGLVLAVMLWAKGRTAAAVAKAA